MWCLYGLNPMIFVAYLRSFWKIWISFHTRVPRTGQKRSNFEFELQLFVRSVFKSSERTIQIYEPKFWSLLTTYGNFVVNLTTGQIHRSLQNPIYWLKFVSFLWLIIYESSIRRSFDAIIVLKNLILYHLFKWKTCQMM